MKKLLWKLLIGAAVLTGLAFLLDERDIDHDKQDDGTVPPQDEQGQDQDP